MSLRNTILYFYICSFRRIVDTGIGCSICWSTIYQLQAGQVWIGI